ncbi:hypothetical protein EYF80_018670 [Liparis tanakae]|uniref:Uncharacterized protein n=1 Tax=Liparis tanakae TaxID=230148 RepID=A0A4Z2I014_9TELE|nr:hypothetical protein EYF80_018670 [Liparis tanakae]
MSPTAKLSLSPPAALVTIKVSTPSREKTRSGYVTCRHKRSELHLLLFAYYFGVVRKMHQMRKPRPEHQLPGMARHCTAHIQVTVAFALRHSRGGSELVLVLPRTGLLRAELSVVLPGTEFKYSGDGVGVALTTLTLISLRSTDIQPELSYRLEVDEAAASISDDGSGTNPEIARCRSRAVELELERRMETRRRTHGVAESVLRADDMNAKIQGSH